MNEDNVSPTLPRRLLAALRTKGRLAILVGVAVLIAAYWAAGFVPAIAAAEPAVRGEVSRLKELTLRLIERPGHTRRSEASVVLSPFVTVDLTVEARGGREAPEIVYSALETRPRYDNIILFLGLTLILFMVAQTVSQPRASITAGTTPVSLDVPSIDAPGARVQTDTSVEEFLSEQVRTAASIANALYDRSTLLIAGGIVMAFVGVGIFYVTVPEVKTTESLVAYLSKIVRPTGMLIFVEAIAWFLLRQYRVQLEDYKAFYRIYLRRANLFVAFKTMPSHADDFGRVAIAAAFLQDDQSGRLRTGETTESIAALEAPDSNPVLALLRDFATAAREKGQEK